MLSQAYESHKIHRQSQNQDPKQDQSSPNWDSQSQPAGQGSPNDHGSSPNDLVPGQSQLGLGVPLPRSEGVPGLGLDHSHQLSHDPPPFPRRGKGGSWNGRKFRSWNWTAGRSTKDGSKIEFRSMVQKYFKIENANEGER